MARTTRRGRAHRRVGIHRKGRDARAMHQNGRLRFETLEPRLFLAGQPVISEFMADNKATLKNSFNAYEDWIEICNIGNEAVTLDNWHLTDSRGSLSLWTFADVLPANQHVVLNPNAYLIVWASSRNTAVTVGNTLELHTNFSLAKDGDYLALVAPNGSTIASEYPIGTGLKGDYYQWTDPADVFNAANLKFTRLDPTVDFAWNGAAPDASMTGDHVAVRWTGKVKPIYTEAHTFTTFSDDGVRLWVNGQLIIDHWASHSLAQDSATIVLNANTAYDVKMEYYQTTDASTARLLWSSAHTAQQVVPEARLFSQSAYNYPQQYKDISFGLGQNISTKTLVTTSTPVNAYVPVSDTDANAPNWNQPGFTPGAAWTSGTPSGVGFDASRPPALPTGGGTFYYGPFGPNGTWNLYEVVTPAALWPAANTAARAKTQGGQSGHLVTIGSDAENLFVQTIVPSDTWIGLTSDPALGGANYGDTNTYPLPEPGTTPTWDPNPRERGAGFVWADATPFTYQKWRYAQPNDSGGANPEYVRMTAGDGTWNDRAGSESYVYVVEYETRLPSLGPGFYVQEARATGATTLASLADAANRLAGPVTTYEAPLLNHVDPEDRAVGRFGGDVPFGGNTAGNDDNVALRASAVITIPTTGVYTFDVHSDDGFGLTIEGASFTNVYGSGTISGDTMTYDGVHAASDCLGVTSLSAGSHRVTLTYFVGAGTAGLEFSAASGAKNAWDTSFRLVGDALHGGLAIQGSSDLLATNLESAMYTKNPSAYVVIPFNVANAADYHSLTLRMKYDDGFVAWLNGQEIARRNAPANVAWNSAATAERLRADALTYEDINVSAYLNALHNGSNVLAIQLLNDTTNSPADALVVPELVDVEVLGMGQHYFSTPSPGTLNNSLYWAKVKDTKFDHDRGFYDAPFDLVIRSQTQDDVGGVTIVYTLDGSKPTLTNGTVYTAPVPITQTTVVRAAAFKPGYEPTDQDAVTYVFPAQVLTQPAAPGPLFPASWNGTVADYEMDPDVVNTVPTADLIAALKSIPTMSISMKADDLFGANGIYSNSWSDYQYPGSLEYFKADGGKDFQVNAAIKMYGGVGRDPGYKKHSFRIIFNGLDGGATKLDFDLFGGKAVKSFDSIILRANFNESWVWGGSGAQYLRDQWTADVLNAVGDPNIHGKYVHLYLNGVYWGMYDAVERPDNAFSASYYGGDKDLYDSRNCNDSIISGTGTTYSQMFNLANTGSISGGAYNANALASAANYDLMRTTYLDVASLADYVLVNYYGSNWDWDGHNWYGGRLSVPGEPGSTFHFFTWDAEGNINDVNGNKTATDSDGNPTRLFNQLRANPEFNMLLADRVYAIMLRPGAPLSPTGAAAIYRNRGTEIFQALLTESARWGDIGGWAPLTRDGSWLPTYNNILANYFPNRTNVFLAQLRAPSASATNPNMATPMYPSINAPQFGPSDSQLGGTISDGFQLTVVNPNAAGTIYYTLDGSDPRLVGGGIAPNALIATSGTPLSAFTGSVRVRARVLDGTVWSALHEETFVWAVPPPVRITEIMYRPAPAVPADQYAADDFEFIELQNISDAPVDLTGINFTQGLTFTFPDADTNISTLDAGAYGVLVKNREAFESRYGTTINVLGTYTGTLSDNGERVRLAGKFNQEILDFTYDSSWLPDSAGAGFSLTFINPTVDREQWDQRKAWRLSTYRGGSPGAPDTGLALGSVVINEVLAHTDADLRGDWVELANTTGSAINVGNWCLSNDATDLAKYRIPANTVIPAGGYLLLTRRDHFGASNVYWSQHGGEVYLTMSHWDAAGQTYLLDGYRESEDFEGSFRETAFARYVTSTGNVEFVTESVPTPNEANAYPAVGPIVINEIMYNPPEGGDEFVELYNTTAAPIALWRSALPGHAWSIDGGISYTFPQGSVIAAHGYLLVVSDNITDVDAFRARYGIPAEVPILCGYSGQLSNSSDSIRLYAPEDPDPEHNNKVPQVRIDRVEYRDVAPWPPGADGAGPSLQRTGTGQYGNDPVNWDDLLTPDDGTPGRVNGPTDVTPPRLLSASTQDGIANRVTVFFNEDVDPATALNPANYALDHNITVLGALAGTTSRSVALVTTALSEGPAYTVTVSGVKNASLVAIGPGAQASFNYVDAGKGLKGEYFRWTDWNTRMDPGNLVLTRTDPVVNFQWGGGAPDPIVGADYFAVRWSGRVKPQYSETYTFYTVTDDGVSLWVNGQALITDNGWHGDTEYSGTIALQAGQFYDIRMEMYEGGGGATATLSWSSASTPKQIIPTARLFDTTIPTMTTIATRDPNSVAVTFSEALQRDSAQTVANYQLAGAGGQTIAIAEAVLQPDRKTVLLSTASPLAQGVTYTLTVNNVVSLRGLPVLPGSQKTFSYVPTPGNTGNILREWWTGIGGSVITDLTSNANYPNNPTGSDYRTIFEAPTDWNDSYGTRMRGYVTAPATGNYYFWIASDDASQLFLSTGTDPANKAMIAYVAGWTGSRAWDTVSTQKSAAIALVAGQTYYIEALQKEGGGGDNLAVGWQLPDATLERPIPANRLTPVIIAPDKTVSIALTDPDAAETGHNKGTFTITRTGNLASAVTVYYTVTGSASTLDFQEDLVQSVQMAAGAASVTIDVTPADDAVYEGNETVKLTLIADKAYSIGAGSAVLTIVDNDPVPPHTMTWKGGANGNWEDANAWTNSPPAWPTVTMDAVVDTASTVNVGADEFARSLSLSNGAGISLAAGKTLTVSATVSLAGNSSLTGGTVVAGAFNLQQGTVSAKLSGPGKLTKTTAGTLVLSGVSDYTGGTLISSGTVTIQNANAFTPGTQLTIGGGARIVLVVGLINTGASMASAVDSAALAAESPLSTMGLLPVESAPVVECDTAQLVRPMFDVPALGAIPGVKWPAISSQRALAHDAAIRALSDLETQSGARFQRARHVGNVPHGLDPMAWLSFLEWPRRGRRPGELRASAAELVDLQSAK